MGSFEPTPEQRRAMEDRGGSLLVSAAAGSGKTKVLVERLFGYMERERCRIDDFLIITFTKAAAAELRGRIAAELSQRVARQPENMHLRRQMMRVYQADIKTVDAFCGSLLRENIHLLPPEGQRSLTPDFRVLDQQEAELLRMQVLEQVLEEFYQRIGRGDTQAQQLAETLGAGRDDRALERLVLDIHGKIQSHAYPMRWLGRLREQWQQVPESVGPYREVLTDSILRRTRFWARKLTETAAWMEQYPDLYRGYGDRFLEMAEQLQGYEAAAQEGWDAMARLKPSFRRMDVVKGCDGAKEQAQAVRKRCKIDWIESNNEYWLMQDARLRTDFNVTSGVRPRNTLTGSLQTRSGAISSAESSMTMSKRERCTAVSRFLEESTIFQSFCRKTNWMKLPLPLA